MTDPIITGPGEYRTIDGRRVTIMRLIPPFGADSWYLGYDKREAIERTWLDNGSHTGADGIRSDLDIVGPWEHEEPWVLDETMTRALPLDQDPSSLNQHQPGAKLDRGKRRIHTFLSQFPNAIDAFVAVAEYGADKYTEEGWLQVDDGIRRYSNALMRHLMAKGYDDESHIMHAAHAAWNAMARLELMLLEKAPLRDPMEKGDYMTKVDGEWETDRHGRSEKDFDHG